MKCRLVQFSIFIIAVLSAAGILSLGPPARAQVVPVISNVSPNGAVQFQPSAIDVKAGQSRRTTMVLGPTRAALRVQTALTPMKPSNGSGEQINCGRKMKSEEVMLWNKSAHESKQF